MMSGSFDENRGMNFAMSGRHTAPTGLETRHVFTLGSRPGLLICRPYGA